MQNKQQRRLDSLRRVQNFLDDNSSTTGALRDTAGRRTLDQAVTTIDSCVGEQAAIDRELAGASARQDAQTGDLRKNHMTPIAEFARARLRGMPDFAALTQSGADLVRLPLIRAARAMAKAAAPHLQALVEDGHSADTIDQLNAAAAALESTIVSRADDRVRRVRATKGIAEALKDGHEGVKRLGSVVRKMFAGDPPFLAAWRAASRVMLKTRGVGVTAAVPQAT